MDTVFVILQSSQRSQILHKKITEDAENGIGVLRKLFFEPDKMTTTSEKDSQKA